MEGAIKHSAEKQLDTTQTLTLTRQRHKQGMDIPRRGVQGGRRKPPLQKNQSMFSTEPFELLLKLPHTENQNCFCFLKAPGRQLKTL